MTFLPRSISEDLIKIYAREYSELCGNWTSLEQKAQLAAGYAGVILTGGLAFLGSGLVAVPNFANWAFPFIAFGLLLSGFFALKGLWVSAETLPPAGEDLRTLAWKQQSEDPAAWLEEYQREGTHLKVVHWDQACKDLVKSLERKGTWVTRAQTSLLVTAGFVFLLVVALSWRALSAPPSVSN